MLPTYKKSFTLYLCVLLVFTLGISTNQSIAGSCSFSGGTYTCSGAASATDSTLNIWDFSNPIRVETSAGFGLETSSGDAFFIYSNGELIFSDAASSMITGAQNGLRASNTGPDQLSIFSSGTITGITGEGIHAENSSNGTDLRISTNRVYGGSNGIVAVNGGSGDLTITASGEVVAGMGIGIWANNAANGGALNISAADVTAVDDGINATNSGSGQLTIITSGSVSAANDNGILVTNASNGTDLRISTNRVSGGSNGIVATNNGSGDLTVTATHAIEAGTGIGIWTNNSVNGGALNISAVDVTAVDDGINATNSGSGQLTITTSGRVSAANDNGIYALNNGSSITSINIGPESIVQGATSGIYLTSPSDGTSTINIYGQVQNITGLAGDNAIIAAGGSTAVNLMASSRTTGTITLTTSGDTVNLLGTVNGDVQMSGGDDTFIPAAGSNFTGTVYGGTGNDRIVFNDMGNLDAASSSATYLGFENLEIQGGTTIFSGDWIFPSGTATIQEGSLLVNGSLTSPLVSVTSGGVLGGSGNITGNVVSSGTISPGNSIGTVVVNGDVDFLSGSIYAVELDGDGSGDKLQVNGAVSINDSTLNITLSQAPFEQGLSWEVIEASIGVSGEFSTVNKNVTSATINFQQVYTDDSLSIVLERTPYEEFGTTVNDTAVGAFLDAILSQATGDMEDLLINIDLAMDAGQISRTLKSLNPEMYTAFTSAEMSSVRLFSQAAGLRQQDARIVNAGSAAVQEPLWNLWIRAFGGIFDREEDNGVTGYSQDTAGIVLGLDRSFCRSLRAGLMIGYSDSDLEWDGAAHSGQLKGTHFGGYASVTNGNYYFDGVAGYASFANSGNRTIKNPALTAEADSSFDADIWHSMLTMGYDFKKANMTYGPVASLNYQNLSQKGFRESGAGDFNLKIKESNTESLCSSVGFQIQTLMETEEWLFRPRAELSWLHEYENDPAVLSASFINYQNTAFRVTGMDPVADQGIMKLGLTAEHNPGIRFSFDYTLSVAQDQNAHLFSAALIWRF